MLNTIGLKTEDSGRFLPGAYSINLSVKVSSFPIKINHAFVASPFLSLIFVLEKEIVKSYISISSTVASVKLLPDASKYI